MKCQCGTLDHSYDTTEVGLDVTCPICGDRFERWDGLMTVTFMGPTRSEW